MREELKPYPEYKDSGISLLGQIPAHWDIRRLRNVAELRVSNVDKHNNENEIPIRLCNYVDVYKHDRISEHLNFMTATASKEEIHEFRLLVDDVLITKDSEIWNDIGVPSLVQYEANDLICGYHLAILRPRKIILTGSYLHKLLQCSNVSSQFSIAANGVTRYGLSHGAIKNIFLTIPPIEEQNNIVRFLDFTDWPIKRYIRAKQKQIKLLEEQKQLIIHQAITRGLNPHLRLKPSGVGWLGEVPEHWELQRLKNLGEAIIGLTYDPRDVVDKDNGTLVLRASNVVNGRIELIDNVYVNCPIPNNLRTRTGDILICARSGSRALIGKNLIITSDLSGSTFGAFMLVFRSAINDYLYYVFNSKLFEYQSGLFLTSTINQLTKGDLHNFTVPIPPATEQKLIIEYLSRILPDIDRIISNIEAKITSVREYSVRLLADVVTGKLDVSAAAAWLPQEIKVVESVEETEILDEESEYQVELEVDLEEGET